MVPFTLALSAVRNASVGAGSREGRRGRSAQAILCSRIVQLMMHRMDQD